MAKFTLAPPPIRDRMVDDNGIATRPYQVWLSLASLALGGSADVEVLQAFTQDPQDASQALQEATVQALLAEGGNPNGPAIDELQVHVAQQGGTVADVREVIEDMKRWEQQNPGTSSPLAPRLDALEVLVASIVEGRGPDEPKVICDTHANRGSYDPNAYNHWLYYETNNTYTDRQCLYLATGGYWIYVCGTMMGSLNPNQKPTDLGGPDKGFQFYSVDFEQLYRWSGTVWHYAPGFASQYIVGGYPQGGLWWPCDGNTYAFSQDDGSTANITVPNLLGDVFLKGASSTGAVQTATRATWEAAAKTDSESSHTHSVDIESFNSGFQSQTTEVQSGSGATVAASHVHAVDPPSTMSVSGTAHEHALSDANAQLKTFSETNGGLPKRIALSWYMRR